MPHRPDQIRYLRGLAARLRSIALSEKTRVSAELLEMANEAEQRANDLESSLKENNV